MVSTQISYSLERMSVQTETRLKQIRCMSVVCIVAIFTFIGRHLQFEDGLIYDRYISNALHGLGLVYNAGEKVNALTSPLYAYLVLGLSWLLHGQVQLAAVLICGVTFAGACVLAERMVPYSGFLIASMAYFYAEIGMETSLLLFLIMLVITLYVESRFNLIPLFVMLLILTRAEAGALALVLAWTLWRQRKLPKAVSFLPAIAVFLAYLFINYRFYGKLTPDSASAKLGQGVSGYWGAWPLAFLHLWHLWHFFAFTPYILAGLVFFGWRGIRKTRGTVWGKVVVPFLIVLFTFYWIFNLPASYFWYYAPFIYFLSIFAIMGIPKGRTASVVLAIVLVAQAATNVYRVQKLANDPHNYAKVAAWLNANTDPDATIEACEIGELGWLSHRYMFDVLGLTIPKNAVHIAKHDATSWLAEDKPDYVIVHKPAWVWEQVAMNSPNYEEAFHSNFIHVLCRKSTSSSVVDAPCVKLHYPSIALLSPGNP
jgi:arabinofuranosyltransferase